VAGGLYAAQAARTGVARLTRISVAYGLAMALLAVMPTVWSAVIACVLVGAASILFLTTGNATVQLAADPGYRGRVMALWSTALVGSTPIGSPIIGALSDAASPRFGILLGAVACAAAAAIGRWPARAGRPQPEPRG
jgi:MFS family permease